MADPVRTASSSDVSTGDPTRSSHYNNLRADVLRALTELDYGATGSIPASPATGQRYLDTTTDELLICLDGITWTSIASSEVVVDSSGLSASVSANVSVLGTAFMYGYAVAPVGADKYATT